jgi:hypothetical protein
LHSRISGDPFQGLAHLGDQRLQCPDLVTHLRFQCVALAEGRLEVLPQLGVALGPAKAGALGLPGHQLEVVDTAILADVGLQAVLGLHHESLLVHLATGGEAARPLQAFREVVIAEDPCQTVLPGIKTGSPLGARRDVLVRGKGNRLDKRFEFVHEPSVELALNPVD